MAESLPHLGEIATSVVSAIMEGEVYPTNSAIPEQQMFRAVHKVVWNNYSEQVFFFLK
jgi:hypothetical protein